MVTKKLVFSSVHSFSHKFSEPFYDVNITDIYPIIDL